MRHLNGFYLTDLEEPNHCLVVASVVAVLEDPMNHNYPYKQQLFRLPNKYIAKTFVKAIISVMYISCEKIHSK